ncbi:MAG TPA: type II toxin-antitoxin system VapC family toxin [Acidobacteriaceae bacterium]|nr:type II toxin-antitoxin system VapC family toxin [Acidobacteriaceae bacterium]
MSSIVLDSSVPLAILLGEVSGISTYSLIDGAVMSAVNLAEVYSKISELGAAEWPRAEALLALLERVEPMTQQQARACGELRTKTRHAGLSLGDRACLALAIELEAEVYTADRAWKQVTLGIPIHLVR